MVVGLVAQRAWEWLEPHVRPYVEAPKTRDELQRAVDTPAEGTDVHHIVEQSAARQDGFSNDQIEAPSNLARISRLKHWEINRWFDAPNFEYEGMTPREYVRGKSWEVRRDVGLKALRLFDILKDPYLGN